MIFLYEICESRAIILSRIIFTGLHVANIKTPTIWPEIFKGANFVVDWQSSKTKSTNKSLVLATSTRAHACAITGGVAIAAAGLI